MHCERRRILLEQTDDLARLVEVDLPESWTRTEAGHGLHVAEDGIEEACTGGEPDGPDGDRESRGNVLQLRIVRERVLRLRHADWSDGQTRCQ